MGTLPATQPVDGNGRPIEFDGWDSANGQYVVDESVGGTPAPGQPFAYAPKKVSLAGLTIPAILQKAAGVSTGNVASLAQAFINANIPGNSIVVIAANGNNGTLTITDSNGNTYNSVPAAVNTSEVQIFFAVGIVGGANTVTATNAGTAASMAIEIYEVSGLLALAQAQPGQTSSGTGTGTTATTSVIAPSIPDSLVFAGVAINTGVVTAVAAGTGLNYDSGTQQPATPSGLYQFIAASGFLGSIGGLTPTATWTTSRAWVMAAAIFKPVAIPVEGTVRIGGYNATNITAAAPTTTLVKTGPGVLHAIVVNTAPASGGTLEIDDALINTNSKGIITSAPVGSIIYDMAFTTGLSITTAIHAGDYTVLWK